MKESAIQRAIGDYLSLTGLCFYYQTQRGYLQMKKTRDASGKINVKSFFRKDANPYALNGLPDYVVIYRGFHQGLEVKRPGETQQANQKEFQFYLTQKGGALYDVVCSVEDVERVLKQFKNKIDHLYQRAAIN